MNRRVPSHDRIGDVVIIRENVLEEYSVDEVVSILRSLYKGLKAIYVKEKTVDEYRVPVLRLLWGSRVELVSHREYGLVFYVLLGRVYYNPRLAEEHRRLASMVRSGERVIDVFSGIGGFAIHIASLREALVVANDLNPYAYRLIILNTVANRKKLVGRIIGLNMDARILPVVFRKGLFDRVIANLPHNSLDFMDVYDHLLRPGGILHLYVLGKDCSSITSNSRVRGWIPMGCRRVLDYSPYTYIYRLNLAKPED